ETVERKARKAIRTRRSARMDGCTPELKAAFAIMPPTPKNAAAVSAKEYPSPSRNGAAAGSTEGPRALGCRPRRPRPGGPRREERVSVDPAAADPVRSGWRLSPLPNRADRGSRVRRCEG